MGQHTSLGHQLLRLRETLTAKHLSGDNEIVEAVVAILLHNESDSGLNTLLIHRAERTDDPWSGQIGLPGGRVQKSDQSVKAALRREVEEEVGLDLNAVGEELGALSIGLPMRRTEIRVQPWVYGLYNRPVVRVGPEAQDAFWVSLSQLPNLRGTAEIDIVGMRRTVDAFLVDGHVVWGFTHRVLNELLTVPGILGY